MFGKQTKARISLLEGKVHALQLLCIALLTDLSGRSETSSLPAQHILSAMDEPSEHLPDDSDPLMALAYAETLRHVLSNVAEAGD